MNKQIPRDLIPPESQFLKISFSYTGFKFLEDDKRRTEIRDYLRRFVESILRGGVTIDNNDNFYVDTPRVMGGVDRIIMSITSPPFIVFRPNGKVTEYKLEVDYTE